MCLYGLLVGFCTHLCPFSQLNYKLCYLVKHFLKFILAAFLDKAVGVFFHCNCGCSFISNQVICDPCFFFSNEIFQQRKHIKITCLSACLSHSLSFFPFPLPSISSLFILALCLTSLSLYFFMILQSLPFLVFNLFCYPCICSFENLWGFHFS